MSFLSALAKLLGIREDQTDDALHSEKAARESLSRRSFFGVSAALVAGTAFSFGAEPTAEPAVKVADPAGAFLRAKRREMDDLYAHFANNLSLHMWGDTGKAIGTLATTMVTL